MRIETIKTDDFTMDYCRFGHGAEALVILPGLSVQRVMGLADAVAQAIACTGSAGFCGCGLY